MYSRTAPRGHIGRAIGTLWNGQYHCNVFRHMNTVSGGADDGSALQVEQQKKQGKIVLSLQGGLGGCTSRTETKENFFSTNNTGSRIADIFLPVEWEVSVKPKFLQYSCWQTVQIAAGTCTGVLSMQALLYAVGLGSSSVPLAGAINWVLKDGLGQLGGILCASFLGSKFNDDPKRYRFWSTVSLQVSLMLAQFTYLVYFDLKATSLLELLTPLFPHLFLPLASISNVGKNVSWLAGSATRAQIHNSFALRDNLGDITGKITAQSIAGSLVGTAMGILISKFTGFDFWPVMSAFVPISAVSLYATYKSNDCAHLTGINLQRAEILMKHLSKDPEIGLCRSLPTPEFVASREEYIRSYRSPWVVPLRLQPSLDIMATKDFNDIFQQTHFENKEKYYLAVENRNSGFSVSLWFDENATPKDQFKGLYHACVIREELETFHDKSVVDVIKHTHNRVGHIVPSIWDAIKESKWDENVMFFAVDGATVTVKT
eukprot:m.51519 g.51519  ORF g.51519 m.51519 type:complete len:487 (+) comp10737_c0_seq6:160-1620(+)